MDTDSLYMAISAPDLDQIIIPEKRKKHEKIKSQFLVVDKGDKRKAGLFKEEFKGFRMIALTSKCYYAQAENCQKISSKGANKRQNVLDWDKYYTTLKTCSKDFVRNRGFRLDKKQIVTYDQSKLGLSAYYDKLIVHEKGIHTKPIFQLAKKDSSK